MAGRSGSRTLTFVYDGSADVLERQHVDGRPGHGGDKFDDTYTVKVTWTIAWKVTIQDDQVLVGTPTVTKLEGTDAADVNSAGHPSCGGPVEVPVINGKRSVRTDFVIVSRTQQFLTVRLEGFPPGWATAPACQINAIGLVPQPPGPAGVTWVYSWGQPEFKIALLNNYKITPASVGSTYQYPLPPNNNGIIWKKVVFDWNARLKIEGFTKETTTTTPTPTPPAKKPCPPVPGPPPGLKSDVIDYYLGTHFSDDDVAWVNGWGDNEAHQLLEDLAVAKGLKKDYFFEDLGRTTRKEACISLTDVPPDPDVMPRGFFREKRAPLPDLPAGWELSVTSSPAGLTIAQTGFPPISGGSVGASTTGSGVPPPGVAKLRVSAAIVKELLTGKPFTLKLFITLNAKGQAPITATRTITLQGPPPTAAISSVTVTGTPQNPAFVVQGTNLGSKPAPNPTGSPSNQPLCPVVIKGNAGLDYGTSLYLNDTTRNFAAGRYRPTLNELDCIGLIVTKFTPTEIDLRPGSGYQQFFPKYQINDGDAVEIAINGASTTVHVKYGTAVSN